MNIAGFVGMTDQELIVPRHAKRANRCSPSTSTEDHSTAEEALTQLLEVLDRSDVVAAGPTVLCREYGFAPIKMRWTQRARTGLLLGACRRPRQGRRFAVREPEPKRPTARRSNVAICSRLLSEEPLRLKSGGAAASVQAAVNIPGNGLSEHSPGTANRG